MIKVSVIVPVYNVGKYLKKCLESLVNQTLKDIEIVVVNDGSTDNSQDIIDEYKSKYPKTIKVIKQTNQGISASRNNAISIAKGKYLAFIDGDDYAKTDMLESSYDYIEQKQADIVVWDYYEVDENDNVLRVENIPDFKDANIEKQPNLLFTINPGPCNKLYKRSLFKDIKFPNDRTKYEDLMTITKILINANKISKLNKCCSYYVIRDNSETRTVDVRSFDIIKALEDINNYMKDKLTFEKFYEEVMFLNIKHIMYQVLKQGYSIDTSMSKKFISKAYTYLNKNFPNWKNNKYYKHHESIIKRTIKNNQLLVKIYCQIFKIIKGGKNKWKI